MKKRWTFELIVDTKMNGEWNVELERAPNDENIRIIEWKIHEALEGYPYELELMKFEARNVE